MQIAKHLYRIGYACIIGYYAGLIIKKVSTPRKQPSEPFEWSPRGGWCKDSRLNAVNTAATLEKVKREFAKSVQIPYDRMFDTGVMVGQPNVGKRLMLQELAKKHGTSLL